MQRPQNVWFTGGLTPPVEKHSRVNSNLSVVFRQASGNLHAIYTGTPKGSIMQLKRECLCCNGLTLNEIRVTQLGTINVSLA